MPLTEYYSLLLFVCFLLGISVFVLRKNHAKLNIGIVLLIMQFHTATEREMCLCF